MKLARPVVSTAAAVCLVALSPGGGAWAAALAGTSAPRLVAGGTFRGTAAVSKLSLPRTFSAPSIAGVSLPAPVALTPLSDARGELVRTGLSLSEPGSRPETALGRLYEPPGRRREFSTTVFAGALGFGQSFLAKSSHRRKGGRTPDSGDQYDGSGRPVEDGSVDELGNRRRSGGEGGPDDRSDPDAGGVRDGENTLWSAIFSPRVQARRIRAILSALAALARLRRPVPAAA